MRIHPRECEKGRVMCKKGGFLRHGPSTTSHLFSARPAIPDTNSSTLDRVLFPIKEMKELGYIYAEETTRRTLTREYCAEEG